MLLAVRISSYGCTWEVWRALKNVEMLSAAPRALTHFSCSPNFPRASITRYTHAKHEQIFKFQPSGISVFCLLRSYDDCIINLQDLCISFKMTKQSCRVTGNVLLRKQNVKAALLYANRKKDCHAKITESLNLQFILTIQTCSQRFLCVVRCFSINRKEWV